MSEAIEGAAQDGAISLPAQPRNAEPARHLHLVEQNGASIFPFMDLPNGRLIPRIRGKSPADQFSFSGVICNHSGLQLGSADLSAEEARLISRNLAKGEVIFILPCAAGKNSAGAWRVDLKHGSHRHTSAYLKRHVSSVLTRRKVFHVIREHHIVTDPWHRRRGKPLTRQYQLASGDKFSWLASDKLAEMLA